MDNKFLDYYKLEKEELTKYIENTNKDLLKKDNEFLKDNLKALVNLNSNGKLVRGTLINLGYKLLQDDDSYSYPLAVAYELFQTSILIHDDIIDNDSYRREKPTIHAQVKDKYNDSNLGNSVAICMGDYGFYYSLKIISENYKKDKNLGKLLSYFSDVVLKTIDGELLDIITPFKEINKIDNPDLENDIMEVYRLKTAYYTITGPLSLGFILGNIEDEKLKDINKFGYNVGIAFQLQDDLLGIYSDSLGKVLGSDIKEFKTTLLYAYTKKNDKLYNNLLSYYGKEINNSSINKVRDIFKKSGALEYVEKKIDKYYNESLKVLNQINWLDQDGKELLKGFVEYLKNRQK